MNAFSLILRRTAESMERCRIQGRVLVGLSGGADSVALLRTLRTLGGVEIAAVYVNHGLREAAACEEAFCAELCAGLGVSFSVKRVQVAQEGSLEAAARDARYQAFYEAMRELNCGTLALAHHMDDQAETILLHLFYGAGMDGIGGMAEYREPIWRPFLCLRRKTLQAALMELGQQWCEDESNADVAFSRNYLRSRVIPMIEKAYPKAVESMARAAEILRDEDQFADDLCHQWLHDHAAQGPWPFILAAPMRECAPAFQRRILRSYAFSLGIKLEFAHVEALRELVEAFSGAVCNLPSGWRGLRTAERLHFLPPGEINKKIRYDKEMLHITDRKTTGDGKLLQAFPADLFDAMAVRSRQPGDWISPFGMHGRMKLKEYMIDRGIDRPFREDWPLACLGSEVLWVIGVGASERLRVCDGQKTYSVEFSGTLPDAISLQRMEEKANGT